MGVRKQEAMHKGAGSRVSAKVGHLVSLGMLQPWLVCVRALY